MAENISIQAGESNGDFFVDLGVWIHTSARHADLYVHRCSSPQELWDLALQLTFNREETLASKFSVDWKEFVRKVNHIEGKPKRISISLDELNIEI